MVEIQKVVGTAFVVAEFRNDENKQAHPLYRDPFVHLFLNQESKEAADRISQSFPPIRNNVRLRTRYFDDRLRLQIDKGYRQILILGADSTQGRSGSRPKASPISRSMLQKLRRSRRRNSKQAMLIPIRNISGRIM